MFQLYDSTRRRICLVTFVFLGILPMVAIGLWCTLRYMPGYVEAEAARLTRQLGWNVKLSGLKRLRPGVVLYEDFEARDPETERIAFRCRTLEVAEERRRDEQGARQPVLVVTATQTEIEAASLDRIRQSIERVLQSGELESHLEFYAADITLRTGEKSQTFVAVSGRLEEITGGAHARLEFRMPESNSSEPAYLRIVRNRQVSPPAYGFELDTGGDELPCEVLAFSFDSLKCLGRGCRFSGSVWANETTAGWAGEIKGNLANLDLGSLVNDFLPYKFSGFGNVAIQLARFRDGRLEQGNFNIAAGPGHIDRNLIQSLIDRLGLVADLQQLPDHRLIEYEQLAVSVTLDSDGLRLCGRCAGADPGTILANGRKSLLCEPLVQPAPTVALVKVLVPQSILQVPVSPETDRLLHRLPIPEARLLPDNENAIPHARLKLRETLR